MVSVPAIEHYSAVMKPVKKDDSLLLKYQESRVQQLRNLGKYEKPDPKPHWAVQIPALWIRTHSELEALPAHREMFGREYIKQLEKVC